MQPLMKSFGVQPRVYQTLADVLDEGVDAHGRDEGTELCAVLCVTNPSQISASRPKRAGPKIFLAVPQIGVCDLDFLDLDLFDSV